MFGEGKKQEKQTPEKSRKTKKLETEFDKQRDKPIEHPKKNERSGSKEKRKYEKQEKREYKETKVPKTNKSESAESKAEREICGKPKEIKIFQN